MFERQMPFSMEAEQAVLGSILIDPVCMDSIEIKKDDFYFPEHAEIFEAMQKLYNTSRSIDTVTLIDAMTASGTYNLDSGREYLTIIANAVPTSANVSEYAKIVSDKARLRNIIKSAESITEAAYSGENADTVMDMAERSISSIDTQNTRKDFVDIKDGIFSVYENLRNIKNDPERFKGISTGFTAVDNVIVGMNKSDLILVGARPGMGKTAFAMNIATHAAATGKKVAVFSLEMSAEQLISRMISSESQIPSYTLRSGNLTDEQWETAAYASNKLSEMQIMIDDTPGISVGKIKSKLRRIKDIDLIVIDYLQLMQSDTVTGNRVQEVGDISRGLKLLAKELNAPVICCAQLSRSPESRPDKRPMLSDLRESGSIEQDADIVMFLYRDDYYKEEKNENSVAEVIVAKNRHGSLDRIKLGWIGKYTKFVGLA